MRLSDQIRGGQIQTTRDAARALGALLNTVDTVKSEGAKAELKSELDALATVVGDPKIQLAGDVRTLLQKGVAEARDRFDSKSAGERWQQKNVVAFDAGEQRTNRATSPFATRAQQLTTTETQKKTAPPSASALEASALVTAGVHLNDGSHLVLPGIGALQQTFVLDGRGRVKEGDASALLESVGFVAAPKGMPIKGDVLVPMMTPTSNETTGLRDAGRELSGYVRTPVSPDAPMNWLHGRTGVYVGDDGGEARIVMLKGGGQDHRSIRKQHVPGEIVGVDGKKRAPSDDFTPSAYATAKKKELVPTLAHRSWSVTGGTNSTNTAVEVENLTRLHGTFAQILDGKFKGTPAQQKAAARLLELAEQHGITAASVLPVPLAVVEMKGYPALDGGDLAYVDAKSLKGDAYKSDTFDALVVYAYSSPAASRLTMPRGQDHLREVFAGKAPPDEMAVWNAELVHLGLYVTEQGPAFRTDQGEWIAVTKKNVDAVVQQATERANARLEFAYCLLAAAGDDKHNFPLRDISLSGAVFDFDFSGDMSLRDKAEHFVQDFVDGGWAAAGRQGKWLAELKNVV